MIHATQACICLGFTQGDELLLPSIFGFRKFAPDMKHKFLTNQHIHPRKNKLTWKLNITVKWQGTSSSPIHLRFQTSNLFIKTNQSNSNQPHPWPKKRRKNCGDRFRRKSRWCSGDSLRSWWWWVSLRRQGSPGAPGPCIAGAGVEVDGGKRWWFWLMDTSLTKRGCRSWT